MSASLEATQRDITASERDYAIRNLTEAREGLIAAVNGLSNLQWNFKPSAACWSAAEILEHVAIVEGRVKGVLKRLPEEPATPPEHDSKAILETIFKVGPDRSTKLQAPPHICPTGMCSPDESLQRFLDASDSIASTLQSSQALRANVFPHPFFGPLDGYEWILLAAAHTARHTAQLLEIRASDGFPA
jgi:hypothetical protein